MLLILVCHFASHVGWVSRIHGGWEGALACLLSQNGQIGVVMFLMTSGWFLVDRPFRWGRLAALWVQVFAYSVTVFAAVSLAVWTGPLADLRGMLADWDGIRAYQAMLLPVVGGQYWFVTAYMVVMLLGPFLNQLLRTMPMRAMLALVAGLLAVGVLPYLGFGAIPFDDVAYAVACYLMGGLLRVHGWPAMGWARALAVAAACQVLALLWNRVALGDSRLAMFLGWWNLAYHRPYPLQIVAGAALFCAVAACGGTWTNRGVNLVASGMFGVYLLHENPLGRAALWLLVNRLVPEPGSVGMRVLTSMWLVPALFALLTLTALLMDRTLVRPLQRLAMGRSHGPRPQARAVHVRAAAAIPLHGDDARGGVDGDDVP